MNKTKQTPDYATMLEQLATTLPPGPAVIVGLAAQAIRAGSQAEFKFAGDFAVRMGPITARFGGCEIRTESPSDRGGK